MNSTPSEIHVKKHKKLTLTFNFKVKKFFLALYSIYHEGETFSRNFLDRNLIILLKNRKEVSKKLGN